MNSQSTNGSRPRRLEYTPHALDVMERRGIRPEWVERAVARPQLRIRDPYDGTVDRFFRRVPERGGRVLRVAVNIESEPWRVVTTFFDRSMRGGI